MITTIFRISDLIQTKQKVLNWIQRFSTFSFLDSNAYQSPLSTQEVLAGAGVLRSLKLDTASGRDAFVRLDEFVGSNKGHWIFGHLGYDFGASSSQRFDRSLHQRGFGDVCFFVPEIVIRISGQQLTIVAEDPQQVYDEILRTASRSGAVSNAGISIHPRLSREAYIATIERLRGHILKGDCYEINFCQEFYSAGATIDPLSAFNKFSQLSPAPFSAMHRVEDQWLLCSSPERYLKKSGNRIVSQPIKGTLRRQPVMHAPSSDEVIDRDAAVNNAPSLRDNGTNDGAAIGRQTSREDLDAAAINELYNSAKDRSENVMIVDLVRNDLSRFCREGSVKVDELFGIYTFPQVYQMISTISGEVDDTVSFASIIEATFPMGSMTGAPKRRVMELIGQYEQGPRGLYSGTLGYIDPQGDFDFNVVIRSILYDSTARYLSMPAGSGITFYSDAAAEWEECLTKAAAMRMVFS